MKSNSGKTKSGMEKKFEKLDDMIAEKSLELESLKYYRRISEEAWFEAIRSYKKEHENHG